MVKTETKKWLRQTKSLHKQINEMRVQLWYITEQLADDHINEELVEKKNQMKEDPQQLLHIEEEEFKQRSHID